MMEPLDTKRRAPVWQALAELFVGRELQDHDYKWVAGILQSSGYSLDELEHILREEVAPVYRHNISALVMPYEMDGWTLDEVTTDIRAYLAHPRNGLQKLLKRFVTRKLPVPVDIRWDKVRSLLP
ncbi:hypothetical protein WL19_30810 [Burkholderia ubonensis]|nr:hypothetical protein WK51_17010 [Burkholderia ubonensis]KVZ61884.1 hypothetical protein WL19_30810 [Burkholderia ubonensis]KVZ90452.1 hypothetical protein WL24_35080 [Burkholderia ubonensis]